MMLFFTVYMKMHMIHQSKKRISNVNSVSQQQTKQNIYHDQNVKIPDVPLPKRCTGVGCCSLLEALKELCGEEICPYVFH